MSTLLPPNATALEIAFDKVMAERLELDTDPLRNLWNPEKCRLDLLPFLAWAVSVDTWDDNWTETQKRQLVRESVEVHRRKGTIGAVRRAVSALWADIEVQEWFQYGGSNYNFKASLVAQSGFDFSVVDAAQTMILKTKNVRSNLEGIDVILEQQNPCYFASTLLTKNTICIQPPVDAEIKQNKPLYFALYTSALNTVTLMPQGA